MKYLFIPLLCLLFAVKSVSQRCDSSTPVSQIIVIPEGVAEFPPSREINFKGDSKLVRFKESDQAYYLQFGDPEKVQLKDISAPLFDNYCLVEKSGRVFTQLEDGKCSAIFTFSYTPKFKLEITYRVNSINIYNKTYKNNPVDLEDLVSDSTILVTASFGLWEYYYTYSVKEHAKGKDMIVHNADEIKKCIANNPKYHPPLPQATVEFINASRIDAVPLEYKITSHKCK